MGKNIIIFIDESGIHKKVDHSTFALAYIKFKNYKKIENKVEKIENDLNIEKFHWAHTVWKVKEIFITEVLKLDFEVKVAVVKNPIHPQKELEKALVHTIVEKNIKQITIDGNRYKWFEKKIKYVLRNKGISVRKLRKAKDEQYAGLRIADMVAGLTRSYFDKKNPKRFDKYYKKLKKKIVILIK